VQFQISYWWLSSQAFQSLTVLEGVMMVGDFINIPAFSGHRVSWTTPEEPTVWLGVRY